MNQPNSVPLRLGSFAGLAVFFALLCLPLLVSDRVTNYTFDESNYHLPAIRQIRAHWPRLDLQADSLSATAPGYQYALATVSFVTTANRLPLRLVNFAVSLGVLGLLWCAWPAGTAPRPALLALLPLAASNFFVKSASCIVTDNAALLATTGALTALFFAPAAPRLGRASALTTAGVFIRQSGLWLLAPLTLRILGEPRPARRLLLVAPPLVILAWLVLAWGGLVPPAWQDAVHAPLASTGSAYLLAVFALLGPAYYAAARASEWRRDLRHGGVIAGALGGLALALLSPSTFSYDAGRWGGYLWDAAAHLPELGRYSPVFLVLSPLGGALLAMMVRRLWIETGPAITATWTAALGAWAVTGLTNRLVFHRYYEPVGLVLLICWLLLLVRVRPQTTPLATRPLLWLGCGQIVLTLITAHARTFGLL